MDSVFRSIYEEGEGSKWDVRKFIGEADKGMVFNEDYKFPSVIIIGRGHASSCKYHLAAAAASLIAS